MCYLLVCRSLTYAQRTEKTLERAKVTSVIIRIPQAISTDGCGYCLKVPERYFKNALAALKDTELYPKKVYVLYDNGDYVEVNV